MRTIQGSKIVGEVALNGRTIYVTRNGKLHVGDGTGPMPSDAEVVAAVKFEAEQRRAQATLDRIDIAKSVAGKFNK